ncbi:chorismate-binding protein, partial [Nocardia cyriacigeorgica]|uniref:chorismate-binding protein n=1 Tax=Nocardia cyriacigeorgica TaxID=135487 RepID=UPI0024579B84
LADPDADAVQARDLLASTKNRDEHAFVIDWIADKLRPLCTSLSIPDEVIAAADVDALVARYRAAGAEVHYLRDRLALHLPLEFLGAPAGPGAPAPAPP